jgi:mannose-6-phosphate isomerase-like protein (cupin superfamily)
MLQVINRLKLLIVVIGCTQVLQGYDMKDRIAAWQAFLSKPENSWQQVVAHKPSRNSNCGVVYELENFLNDPNEGFAIVDMRNLAFAEPHYHLHDEVEIYIVLQGTACVVVGKEERYVVVGDVIVTLAGTAHYVIPDDQFVIAVINTPPFDPKKYVQLTQTNESVSFDYEQFTRLVKKSAL